MKKKADELFLNVGRPAMTNVKERAQLRRFIIHILKIKKWTITDLYDDVLRSNSGYSKNLKIQIFKMYSERPANQIKKGGDQK